MRTTILCAVMGVTAAAASAATYTTIDIANFGTTSGWSNVGTSPVHNSLSISGERPRSGNGSLRLETTGTQGKAAATFGSTRFSAGPILGTLGDLAAGSISFDWLVDSSTTAAGHLAPAIEFAVRNAQGQSAYLKWEAVYNGGGTVATDTWVHSDITDGNFWMFSGGGALAQYSVTLAEWAAGESFAGHPVFDASSVIVGWSIQAGSGWTNHFLGYVDNVNITFGNGGATYNANFELEGQVIPTPLAGVMGGAGLMLVGARRRR